MNFAQVAGMFGVAHRRADLHELFDRLLDLVVEDEPVRYHDHGVEDLLLVLLQGDELVASQAMELDLPLPAECWTR